MMNKKIAIFLILIFTLIIVGYSNSPNRIINKDNASTPKTVSANVTFRAFNQDSSSILGVTILIIRSDGKVINRLTTNSNGEASKEITVPIDKRYPITADLGARGTVTVIAFKNGYKETVLLEVPISNGSAAQPFYMEPMDPESRNEPIIQIGNNHHLEVLSLVKRYYPYAKKANNGN